MNKVSAYPSPVPRLLVRLAKIAAGFFLGSMAGAVSPAAHELGTVGHSFGGATALQFCHEDARCRAAIDLDGIPFGSVVTDGLAKPAMFC
jgi:pimeloyl-ACP methyl ester carboxylesterase